MSNASSKPRNSRTQEKRNSPSRREFLGQAIGAGAVLPSAPNATGRRAESPRIRSGRSALIRVGAPAGPPPLGAPVESSIPFARGELFSPGKLAIFGDDGKPVLMQSRVASAWPDGSVRWLAVVFEAASGPGDYTLREGSGPEAPDVLQQKDGRVLADAGDVVLTFGDDAGGSRLETIAARASDRRLEPLLAGHPCCDLVLTTQDGTRFRAGLAGNAATLSVDDNGPVKATVRLQGKLRAPDGRELFDFIFRWSVFRARPEVYITATWINTSDSIVTKIRDIRLVLPFSFSPDRLVFGCERGVYDGPFLRDWPVYILQEGHDRYWAKTLNPDGRVQHMSSGGCNGDRAPGWLYIQNQRQCLGVWVPNFHEEYPNEIFVGGGELSVGLWPERAAAYLSSGPVLPANPFGEPYSCSKYWPIMPHPYAAFLDAGAQCLDARQGMAKTQDIIVSVWAGSEGGPSFERKWWSKALQPVRGHVEPEYAAVSGALGTLSSRLPRVFPRPEQLFDENFHWLDSHIDLWRCYGKFDYGDFKYMTTGTDYMCHPGTKWGAMGEMPREGYWHNNERDPLLGLLLYYYRTGNPKAWERCRIVARHLFDVDISHHPHWGMWTHSYGHCYLAQGRSGEPDHSWLLGMLHWAQMTGDPVAMQWILRCGDALRAFAAHVSTADARSVSVYLHMMCHFHAATGRAEYLEAAHEPARTLLRYQKPNGGWPAYLGNPEQTIEGFVEHVAMALADYYALTREAEILVSLERALEYLFGKDGEKPPDPGESSLAVYSLAVLSAVTEDRKYADLGLRVLEKMHGQLDPDAGAYGRGDAWTEWGVNNPKVAPASRPAQLLGQTRPLSPASNLAYAQPLLGAAARLRKLL